MRKPLKERLINRYAKLIRKIASTYHDYNYPGSVQDTVQELYLFLWEKFNVTQLRQVGCVKLFLLRKAFDMLRSVSINLSFLARWIPLQTGYTSADFTEHIALREECTITVKRVVKILTKEELKLFSLIVGHVFVHNEVPRDRDLHLLFSDTYISKKGHSIPSGRYLRTRKTLLTKIRPYFKGMEKK